MLLSYDHLPRPISSTPEIETLIKAGAAVAVGISGGRDSQCAAIATWAYLDSLSHTGPRVLVHADLGMVEWDESLPACEELAAQLGAELVVVRRPGGGLMERFESRWESSVRRYANLETVTLVLPFSTASMRFCTSETKVAPINAELRRRFRGMPVINVTGVRRQESAARAKCTISQYEEGASRRDTPIYSFRPIADYLAEQVLESISRAGMKVHVAYTEYQSTRLSCRFCMLASLNDLTAASRHPASKPVFRRLVGLEARSSFAFQGSRWLGDVAPHLLEEGMRVDLERAKQVALARRAAEARIPKSMLYVKGWPTARLTRAEAELLAGVRREVASLIGIDARYLDADTVMGRYDDLLALKAAKGIVTKEPTVPRQMTLDELLAAA